MGADNLSGTAALVTGASGGFGRAITGALLGAGAEVVGVARDSTRLSEMQALLGESFTAVTADAADPLIAGQLIDQYQPRILVLNAGATALPRPSSAIPGRHFPGTGKWTSATPFTGYARRFSLRWMLAAS